MRVGKGENDRGRLSPLCQIEMWERCREGREVEEGEGEMVTEGDRDEGEKERRQKGREILQAYSSGLMLSLYWKSHPPFNRKMNYATTFYNQISYTLFSPFLFQFLSSSLFEKSKFHVVFFFPLHFLFFMFFPPQHFLLHVWWHLVWNTSEQLSVYSQWCRMEGKFPWRRRALWRNFSTIHT